MTLPIGLCRCSARRLRAAGTFLLLLAGCASPAPPKPNVNLSGYPPEFRAGYVDGCASARGSIKRDNERFRGDAQYAQGWRDGKDICQRR